jgi:peptidoglycan LD-endopeptidase CwlK
MRTTFRSVGCLLLVLACTTSVQVLPSRNPAATVRQNRVSGGVDPECLAHAYPQQILQVTDGLIRWTDGGTTVWDGCASSGDISNLSDARYDSLVLRATLGLQLSQSYRSGAIGPPVLRNHDPGRMRDSAFFDRMYGGTRMDVEKHLVRVMWLPGRDGEQVRVTSVNGVAHAVEAIARELVALPADLRKCVRGIGGGFAWRRERMLGTRSPHAWGIAIDIAPGYGNYWGWDLRARGRLQWRCRVPVDVVRIFERHGFIWGGRWWHYDTMHFEYRPELLECGIHDAHGG